MKFTTVNGHKYQVDEQGVHQLNPAPFQYDESYCAIYDSPERKAKSDVLQALRLAFGIGAHGKVPYSILDFGSGNFAFLNFAKQLIEDCNGFDLADYPVPEGINKVPWYTDYYDIVFFNDAIEHVQDPSEVISNLNCETVVISLPYCHFEKKGRAWFERNYFHLKPSEHLHHFNENSLANLMSSCGWFPVAQSNHEDIIRKRGNDINILSMAFKRK